MTRRVTLPVFSIALGLAGADVARAGGTAENVLLIIDPTSPDSLQIGNHYRTVRNIPPSNVLYMQPGAADWTAFTETRIAGVVGTVQSQRMDDHIDYVVVAAPQSFYVNVPAGLVFDGCSPVGRFSISGAYTMALLQPLTPNTSSETPNRYYSTTNEGRAFDSNIGWAGGVPSTSTGARRYFIGAALGYLGPRGNTVGEILQLIDRSAAVDGTRPMGTFYFEQTSDPFRSPPRHGAFPSVVAAIIAAGGMAEHQIAVMPWFEQDVMGVMTGYAEPNVDGAGITILPGAFCDHLTSWAATFDIADQEKVSRWIANGAAGSWGTVEEPCNYPGKFPHARMHLYYYQGLSLGEAVFRSVGYVPFQGLLYGDPLTRPFAYLPTVNVPDAPTQPVSGTISISPVAATAAPGAAIAGLEMHVDGIRRATRPAGQTMDLDTTRSPDGWHDVRVLAFDNTLIKSAGRWAGSIVVNNRGQSASVDAEPLSGNAGTAFEFDVSAAGSGVQEIRLVQGTRVLAAAAGSSASFTVNGQTLGAGSPAVQAEALFPGTRLVRSAPLTLQVAAGGSTPSGNPPIVYGYTKKVLAGKAVSVELPAVFDGDLSSLTYVVVTPPASATIPAGQSGPSRLVRPPPAGVASDSFTFRVDSPAGSSATVTVRLEYTGPCFGDIDEDGATGLSDLAIVLSNYGTSVGPFEDGDLDGSGIVNIADLTLLLSSYGTPCP
jgi:hypothetical protein